MIDESMDKEQMIQPPKPWEFRSKPAWQRLIIMLGGVTVNLILGFLIYMMILFVWGKYTLASEDLPLGLDPTPIVSQLGFETGDQILSVDGESLENVLDINKYFLLREVNEVRVRRKNGGLATIYIPDDIGTQIFESGQMIPFVPVFPAMIDSVIPNSPASKIGLLSNDKILSLNGNKISSWSDFKNNMTKDSKEIDLVLLVAPTTPKDRMKKIAETSNGFTYLVSVTGVTGERSSLEENVGTLVKQLKYSSSGPIAVGFGISEVKHIQQVREWGADGAIVGSALVKRIANASIGMKVKEAGSFCKELRSATN